MSKKLICNDMCGTLGEKEPLYFMHYDIVLVVITTTK